MKGFKLYSSLPAVMASTKSLRDIDICPHKRQAEERECKYDAAAREATPLLDRAIDGRAARTCGGFALLLAIGIIVGATRTGFLTFLPFLLKAKGASQPNVGVAPTLVFAGGAAGKLVCGFLGTRISLLATVIATEGATAIGIAMSLLLPLGAALAVLPAIGIA
jgi:MFS transporter, FSR family, fosmidomycin resistance protein